MSDPNPGTTPAQFRSLFRSLVLDPGLLLGHVLSLESLASRPRSPHCSCSAMRRHLGGGRGRARREVAKAEAAPVGTDGTAALVGASPLRASGASRSAVRFGAASSLAIGRRTGGSDTAIGSETARPAMRLNADSLATIFLDARPSVSMRVQRGPARHRPRRGPHRRTRPRCPRNGPSSSAV